MLNKLLPHNSPLRHQLRLMSMRANLAVTSTMRRRFTEPSDAGQLKAYLRDTYIPAWYEGVDLEKFHASAEGQLTLNMHLWQRLQIDRLQMVPWINSLLPLDGARILEIGCGTGSATLSLAEQGAAMTAMDLDPRALGATSLRCSLHGVPVSCIEANAKDLGTRFPHGHFDMVIFFAVLEHMTIAERHSSLRAAWDMLRPGQYLCVTDTPNRLWPLDTHTSHLPFFHWLPDELAYAYSEHSPHFPFNSRFRGAPTADSMLNFVRHGRGVSYHELELALGDLHIVSDQTAFIAARNPAKFAKRLLAGDGKRERFLNSFVPGKPRALMRQSIDVILRKPD